MTCTTCQSPYQYTPADAAFFDRMQVPAPTECPDCIFRHLYAFRNEKTLYHRACGLCGKDTLAMFSPSSPYTVYCVACWKGDGWDPLRFGQTPDLTQPFFPQFHELWKHVPQIALFQVGDNPNCAYANYMIACRGIYLAFSTIECENVLYSRTTDHARDVVDCVDTYGGELLYGCIDTEKCFASAYLERCVQMTDSVACMDCVSCGNCFGSANLKHKKFYWLGTQLSEEAWQSRFADWSRGSRKEQARMLGEARAHGDRAPKRYGWIMRSEDSTGDHIQNCRNCKMSFDGAGAEMGAYMIRFLTVKDARFICHGGLESELLYQCMAINRSNHMRFSVHSTMNTDCEYVAFCESCTNCFGCVGLKNKKYCILNQQYTESEYRTLREQLVSVMRERGEYGRFFPYAISPFAYNESYAHEYYPLSRDEASRLGARWADTLPGQYGKETMLQDQVPDAISKVQDEITRELLACTRCGKNYSIIKPELGILRRLGIALPEECFDCRLAGRTARHNPRHLWTRACACEIVTHAHHPRGPCPNQFETTYSPDRPERVFCEPCYQSEVS